MFSGTKGQLPRCAVPLNQEATHATLAVQIDAILMAANKAAKMDDQLWQDLRRQLIGVSSFIIEHSISTLQLPRILGKPK